MLQYPPGTASAGTGNYSRMRKPGQHSGVEFKRCAHEDRSELKDMHQAPPDGF